MTDDEEKWLTWGLIAFGAYLIWTKIVSPVGAAAAAAGTSIGSSVADLVQPTGVSTVYNVHMPDGSTQQVANTQISGGIFVGADGNEYTMNYGNGYNTASLVLPDGS